MGASLCDNRAPFRPPVRTLLRVETLMFCDDSKEPGLPEETS